MAGKLYRGVPSNTARGKDGLRGIVIPRGSSTDYPRHVMNNPNAATDATSWTRDRQIAAGFGDVILEINEADVAGRIIDPHPLPHYRPHEREVLVRGPVHGAQVTLKQHANA